MPPCVCGHARTEHVRDVAGTLVCIKVVPLTPKHPVPGRGNPLRTIQLPAKSKVCDCAKYVPA